MAYKAPVLTLYSVEVIIFSIAHYKVLKIYGSQISKYYKRIIMLYTIAQVFKLSNVYLFLIPSDRFAADLVMDAVNYMGTFIMTDIIFYQVIFKMREIKIL